jgi:endo-1,4-beta-xylanase
MLAWLETRGIHVDGVGFQSHEYLNWPSTDELQAAFDRFVAAGYKLKISELDVTVYDDYASGSFVASPQAEYTPELEDEQARRFASLFAAYRNNRDSVTSVTFWGVSDNRSWLNYVPVVGRADYPLLYKDATTPKAARAAIMDF